MCVEGSRVVSVRPGGGFGAFGSVCMRTGSCVVSRCAGRAFGGGGGVCVHICSSILCTGRVPSGDPCLWGLMDVALGCMLGEQSLGCCNIALSCDPFSLGAV